MEFEVEKMIIEIRERPELWDTSSEIYKDRNKKKEAWKEVLIYLFDDFEEKTKEEKMYIGKSNLL